MEGLPDLYWVENVQFSKYQSALSEKTQLAASQFECTFSYEDVRERRDFQILNLGGYVYFQKYKNNWSVA